jgi:hypothetical protein
LSDDAKPVAENISALMAELDDHRRRVGQALARDERAEARDVHSARRDDTRRKIIMGGAVMAEAKVDPEFAKVVTSILNRRVADPRDRLLLALDIEADAGDGARLVTHLKGRGDVAMSTDAILTLTREQLPETTGLPSPAEFDAMAEAAGRTQDKPKH